MNRFAWFVLAFFVGFPIAAPLAILSAAPSRQDASQPESWTLDGTTALDPAALAAVAEERIKFGARWLANVVQEDGTFSYIYDPGADEYVTDDYNEVRHAGTLAAMYQAHGVFPDDRLLMAAERAVAYIEANSLAIAGGGRAYVDPADRRTSLGGQALAIVALLERRRVTGLLDQDGLIADLASFLLTLETPDEPGRYYSTYIPISDDRRERPSSPFYPGETLLALTRLARQFPDGPYLDAAIRAASHQIYRADGDLVALGAVPRDDHWLTIALNELYRLDPEPDYLTVSYLQADRMIGGIATAADGYPARIGAVRSDGPISYTSTATKGEALAAAWAAARHAGDPEQERVIDEAMMRTAQFLMRVQYTPETAQLLPNPERAIGGWAASPVDETIRIDFVQHNLSALIGMWSMIVVGDVIL